MVSKDLLTVKSLIEELQKHPDDMEVIIKHPVNISIERSDVRWNQEQNCYGFRENIVIGIYDKRNK